MPVDRSVVRLLPFLLIGLSAQAQTVDLAAIGLEVTQGIQDLNNSVRLVAQKPAFVRFHVQAAQNGVTATAALTVTKDGNSVTLAPLNPDGVVAVPAAPDRTVAAQSFLFGLPDGFRDGSVTLRAEVNPDRSVAEPDYSNNVATTTVVFEPVPPLNLVIYSVGYTGADGNFYIPDDSHVKLMLSWIVRAWPVSSVRYWYRKEDVTKALGPGLPDCERVNAFLAAKRMQDLQSPSPTIPVNARYYGMVDDRGGFMRGCADALPGYTSSGPTGVSGTPDSFTWDTDGSYGDWYGSHEVAHNFARFHAEFCSASDGQPYPYPNGRISPTVNAADSVVGFDIQRQRVLNSNWKDNMTYCDYQWIGKFTYHALMDALQQNIAPTAAARRLAFSAAAASSIDRLLVVGAFNTSTSPVTVEMSPFYLLRNAVEIQPRVPGSYSIVLKNASGPLATYPFTPKTMHSGLSRNPSDPEINLLSVEELVPYVDGATQVDITGPDGSALYSVKAGAAFPVVQIQSPAGGETLDSDKLTFSWTASDPDGDTLSFTVQYSQDGGQNWETVDENLTTMSTTLDRVDFQGSTNAMIRVLATDGIHTTVATSKSFTLAPRGPSVSVEASGGITSYVKGETVELTAVAYDPDSGAPAESAITWSSNIDGALGAGSKLAVSKLSTGTHTITVSVADSEGLPPTTATISIAVYAKASDIPPVSDALVIEPQEILLDPAGGQSSEVFEVLNANPRIKLNWSATADQPWIRLDTASGATPGLVTVSLGDITSLPAGASNGSITVQTSGGAKTVVPVQVLKGK